MIRLFDYLVTAEVKRLRAEFGYRRDDGNHRTLIIRSPLMATTERAKKPHMANTPLKKTATPPYNTFSYNLFTTRPFVVRVLLSCTGDLANKDGVIG